MGLGMPIEIEKVAGGKYTARVTPPHGRNSSVEIGPLLADDLIRELQVLGCHQTDIGDAFYDADPLWAER